MTKEELVKVAESVKRTKILEEEILMKRFRKFLCMFLGV